MLNRHKSARRVRSACAAGLILALLLPTTGRAQIPAVGVDVTSLVQPTVQSVQELLELEARRALEEEKRKTQGANNGTGRIATASAPSAQGVQAPGAVPVIAAPRLLAITGVGKQLSVMIDQGGRRAHYRTGSAEPVAGPDLGLRLQAVSQPCASFVDQSQDVVTYCLNRGTP